MRWSRGAAALFGSFVVACSLLPRTSAAQSLRRPPSGVDEPALTIDAAVREAIEHNLTLVAERYSIAVADARILTPTADIAWAR